MLVHNKTINKYYWYCKEITETEYNCIFDKLRDMPEAPEGKEYRLTEGLEWELYELPHMEFDEE